MEKSHLPDNGPTNGLPRTTSRRRRPSGAGQGQYESFPRPGPEAPEVPKAPPASYREPHAADPPAEVPYNNPTSFAARARGGPNDVATFPESPIEDKFDSTAQRSRQDRRSSIRRSSVPKSNGVFTSSSYAGTAIDGPLPSPSVNANGGVPRNADTAYTQLKSNTDDAEGHAAGVPSRSNTRRTSAGGQDPRKEWAVDRSPLQKLEGKLIDISKEERRARVEEAEKLLRERKTGAAPSKESPGSRSKMPNPTTSGRDSTTVERRRSNRPSKQGVAPEPMSASRVPNDLSPNHPQGDDPKHKYSSARQVNDPMHIAGHRGSRNDPHGQTEPDRLNQGTRGQREPSFQSSQPADISPRSPHQAGHTKDRLFRSQRTSQHERQDEAPRKGDVRFASQDKSTGDPQSKQVPRHQQGLYDHRLQSSGKEDDLDVYGGRKDPLPRHAVQNDDPEPQYTIPPQTAGGIAARLKVGFGGEHEPEETAPAQRHHRLSKLLNHRQKQGEVPTDDYKQHPRHLDDWRKASIARLTAADFASVPASIADAPNKYNAWWDKDKSSRRAIANATGGEFDDSNISQASTRFEPPLYLKCGPLLRFTGLQRSKLQQPEAGRASSAREREVWRGSILIVTTDSQSDYTRVPVLEMFPEPMDLLPPPPHQVKIESGQDLPEAYMDPVAGLPKLTRNGGVVYVRPTEDLDHEKDLSRVESDDGLFERTRTANVPTSYGRPNTSQGANGKSPSGTAASRRRSNQKPGAKQVQGARLHAERGVTFWRFSIEIELTERQQRIGYRINNSASVGFWVPATGETMNMMFHSCNGFSMSVDPDTFSGPDPLWRDVLNNHQSRPFHVMLGGGDQIYNDRVMSETTLFQEWLSTKNPVQKHQAPFSLELRDELEAFYLDRYSMWFSQGLFGMAVSQIPMINIWDDHDIIDGFGSYPHHFMSTPVFTGLGAVAFKYYMLFQHQSVADEGPAEEPSWLLGAAPGPYINELSRSLFMFLGKNVAFLGLDCRTERMRDEILSEATYELAFDRCRREIVEGETKHLIVLLGVPIAYPRLNFLENVLTSRIMDPIKALGRVGMLGGFVNKLDGGVEILDDLDDHWTAKHHKQERNWFIQELQELAAEKSIRVTILGGDVHLAAIGQFYSSPKMNLAKDRDHRYMPNVISSAIVNTPPPDLMADVLNKRDKKHYLDKEEKSTLEDMIPMFTHDVDGKARNNKRLLPRRNWCSIREYHPGSTPRPTPPESEHSSAVHDSPQPPPNRLQRTLSLGRGDVKPNTLIRRLSGRARPASPDYPISNQYQPSPRMPTSPPQSNEDYFSHEPKRASTLPASHANGSLRHSSAPLPRPGNFHRRPTNMSVKAVLKGGADTMHEEEKEGHINLEHGLDICINCEVNQKDPAGITTPYRLLVPALWVEGLEDVNRTKYRKKGVLDRFRSIKIGRNRKSGLARRQGQGEWGGGGGGTDSYTPSISETSEQYESQMTQQARPVISNPIPLPRQQQQQDDRGYPGRRPSKADRMLGTMDDHHHRYPAPAAENGGAAGLRGEGARTSSTRTSRGGVEPFQSRPLQTANQHDDIGMAMAAGDRISTAGPAGARNSRSLSSSGANNNGVVLGQGAKISSAGSRSSGPQGLQTGNGSVKMGMGEKVKSATRGSMTRSGSRGYEAPDDERTGGGDGIVFGRGEKVRSGGGGGDRFPSRDNRYQGYGEGDGYGGDDGYSYSEGSQGDEYGARDQPPVKGEAKGYGGIEAYKAKSWRRFF
ncbi:MAG: hypothetical protein L6R42_003944 [Xanthoria sp. 1 TBL-2021]|nr:MAG: hypothetical protein L6R42_003944 [Xanthoria sp. 1 TBL-2021]